MKKLFTKFYNWFYNIEDRKFRIKLLMIKYESEEDLKRLANYKPDKSTRKDILVQQCAKELLKEIYTEEIE